MQTLQQCIYQTLHCFDMLILFLTLLSKLRFNFSFFIKTIVLQVRRSIEDDIVTELLSEFRVKFMR